MVGMTEKRREQRMVGQWWSRDSKAELVIYKPMFCAFIDSRAGCLFIQMAQVSKRLRSMCETRVEFSGQGWIG